MAVLVLVPVVRTGAEVKSDELKAPKVQVKLLLSESEALKLTVVDPEESNTDEVAGVLSTGAALSDIFTHT